MTSQEILEKAICKAKGYPYGCIIFPEIIYNKNYYSIIFDRDFAKAFWGEELSNELCPCNLEYTVGKSVWKEDGRRDIIKLKDYEFYLQQMILEENPLKYLEKFL